MKKSEQASVGKWWWAWMLTMIGTMFLPVLAAFTLGSASKWAIALAAVMTAVLFFVSVQLARAKHQKTDCGTGWGPSVVINAIAYFLTGLFFSALVGGQGCSMAAMQEFIHFQTKDRLRHGEEKP